MKLLIVTQVVDTEDPVLGFFVRWIAEFAKHFEHIEVIALKVGKYEFPENVRVHSLGKENGRPLFGALSYAARFKWLAWKLRREYDTVFVHMNPEYLVLAGWFWKLFGKRVALWYTHKSVDAKLRVAVFFADVVFTASKESFRLPTKKLQVMGHGIDIAQFTNLPRAPRDGKLRVLTTGRLSNTKRVLEMLSALDVLHADGVPFEFTVAGGPATDADKMYEKDVRAEVAKRSYKDAVHLVGPVSHDEIPQLLAHTDVFINLSSTGSMDKAVLEALLVGVPVVTTNEAFRDLLAPVSGLFCGECVPELIAAALRDAPARDISLLSASVKDRFSLEALIARVSERLRSAQS